MLTALLLAGTLVFYGPVKSQCLAPSADSSTSGWTVTGGGGTHRDAIDDPNTASCLWGSTHDSDTTFIQCPASTSCNDLVDVTNSSGLSGKTILYVTTVVVCKENSVPTNGNVTVSIVEGGTTTSTGTSSGCAGVSYLDRTAQTRLYTNPRTGVAWTTSDVDGIQLRLERASLSGTVNVTAVNLVIAYEDSLNYGTPRERSGGGS